MSTIGSSIINKSGKKFLPKAPGGRRRPDTDPSRTSSQPPSTAGDRSTPGTPHLLPEQRPTVDETRLLDDVQASVQEGEHGAQHNLPQPAVSAEQPTLGEDSVQASESRAGEAETNASEAPAQVSAESVSGVSTRSTRSRTRLTSQVEESGDASAIQLQQGAQPDQPRTDAETRIHDHRIQPPARETNVGVEHSENDATASKRRKRAAPTRPRAPTSKRRKTQRTTQTDAAGNDAQPSQENAEDTQEAPATQTRKRRRTAKSAAPGTSNENGGSIVEAAEDLSAEASKSRRRRVMTPEGAEDQEIDPSRMTMDALTKDTRIGKKSAIEARMQEIDWAEVKQRRREADEREEREALERMNGTAPPIRETTTDPSARDGADADENPTTTIEDGDDDIPIPSSTGPRLKLVNGQMVIDNNSLTVDRHAAADAAFAATGATADEIEEDELTARVNSHSYLTSHRRDPRERKAHGAPKSDPWGLSATENFYEALRMCGTDFFMMSQLLPGKSRRQCKMKFVREEKENEEKVKLAVTVERIPLDLGRFERANGKEEGFYRDPGEVHEELRKLEEEQREEIERKRQEEEEAARQKQEAAAARMAAGKGGRGGKRGARSKQANADAATVKKGRKSKKQASSDPQAAEGPANTSGDAEAAGNEAVAADATGEVQDNTETVEVEGEALS